MKYLIIILIIMVSSCSLLDKSASLATGDGCIKGEYDKHSGQYCKK